MIKAVIFDWGGVLVDDPAPGYVEYCAKYLKIPAKELKKTFQKYHSDLQKGLISEEFFWSEVCSKLGIPEPSPLLWKEAFGAVYSEKKEIFATVSSLKESGYKLAVLSNTEMSMVDFFNEQNYQFFDVAVFSCLEGTAKPDKRIYELTLEKLGVQAEEAVFIDDKQENISGAEKVGIKTILFKNVQQFKEDLSCLISLP
jgi:epoxide hydrolase-like predicted phosphatase